MLTRRTFLALMGASSSLAVTGPELLALAAAAPVRFPHGSRGVEHIVVLMMENRSFDHFLGWPPGADGRTDLTFPAPEGNVYPNYPLAPDFQGCVVTYDEWGGFYDHVPPPKVRDDTNPDDVDHAGDTPTDGRSIPDYRQLGFRVPAIVASNLAPARVAHHGPFEHTSSLKLIESTFGLRPLTARDRHAEDIGQVLDRRPRRPVPDGVIPRGADVLGPVSDAAAGCGADSARSVSPEPVHRGSRDRPGRGPGHEVPPQVPGMATLGREYRRHH